jgi:N-acetylglucosaminyldiphosphoundecaprenol N-acetyl-beta-D-mannosaminyltransferase
MVEISDVVRIMDRWIETEPQRCHHVVNSGMHGIMEARRDPVFKAVLEAADLFAPDGILVVLVSRLRGFSIKKRNTGPELLSHFAQVASDKGRRCFFYGDTERTLQLLASTLTDSFPGLRIAGMVSPPFRPLTLAEEASIIQDINEAEPDVLWVGLGMPKQEWWIARHRDQLKVPVVVGAGASFKFLGGTVRRAPAWLRNSGFEWLLRLYQEPERVWRRVFLDAPLFIGLVALELSGLKRYR